VSGPLNADPNKHNDDNPASGPPSEPDQAAVNEGPAQNPPSHGDPTNPAQPKG
jgi:hypothetical protein